MPGPRLPGPRLTEKRMRLALGCLGVTQLAIGVWLLGRPGLFHRHDRRLRSADHTSCATSGRSRPGSGIALLAARAGGPPWRVPVLFAALAQSALHTINHLFDIGDTDPGWQGPFNFVGVLLLTARSPI